MSHHLYLPDAAKPRHRQLKRLILAIRDMGIATKAAAAASKLPERDEMRTALISAAVVAYARPFASGRSWGRLSSKWESFDDPNLREVHCFINTWRDSVVAHNDEELNEVEFLPKGSFMDFKADAQEKTIRLTMAGHGELLRTPSFPAELIPAFVGLCELQAERMKKASNEEKNLLFDEFIRPAKKKG